MTTLAQALDTAHRWVNGELAQESPRPVRAHEFDLGWVVWPEPAPVRLDPLSGERRAPEELGAACAVVDRFTGELTVWPSVPVQQVIRLYRDRTGAGDYDPALPPAIGPGCRTQIGYRDALGEDRTLVLRSATGRPHPALRAWRQLTEQGIPPEDVVSVHTDLRPAMLPGGYVAAAVLAALPTALHSHDLAYGPRYDGRARAVRAAGAANPRPNRVPFPTNVPPAQPEAEAALVARLAAQFGPQGVRRFDPAHTAAADLPEAVAAPLQRIGLPVLLEGWFTLHHPVSDGIADGTPDEPVLPDLAGYLAARGLAGRAGEQARRDLLGQLLIGTDGWALLSVDTAQGRIRAVDPETAATRYVNADLTAFVRSLALFADRLPKLRDLHPLAAGQAVAELQWSLAGLDRTVFNDPENWWAVIVEQLWHGVL
ncbi:SUKH-4 family immunity protein [Kitasatospora sp. NPDC002040]|uniref:SUKH-4 family immunity protein n=1 Tax=Kitasatospora sp. NPDC002040 TaxID=3154661 RepID=UPI0033194802